MESKMTENPEQSVEPAGVPEMKTELTFASYELAQTLDELGLNWYTDYYYNDQKKLLWIANDIIDDPSMNIEYYAPTQALAQMWFEEVCNIYIYIEDGFDYSDAKNPTLHFSVMVYIPKPYLETIFIFKPVEDNLFFKTKQEALEFGLIQACEYLIKHLKTK